MREGLVHYIWRHRPKDFEDRYLADILKFRTDVQDEGLLPEIERDFKETGVQEQNQRNEEGKYPPLPLPFAREWEIRRRDGGATQEEYDQAKRAHVFAEYEKNRNRAKSTVDSPESGSTIL
jgi:hypothetical protein